MFLVSKIRNQQPFALQNRELLLHLVHPGAMDRGKVEDKAWGRAQPCLDLFPLVHPDIISVHQARACDPAPACAAQPAPAARRAAWVAGGLPGGLPSSPAAGRWVRLGGTPRGTRARCEETPAGQGHLVFQFNPDKSQRL